MLDPGEFRDSIKAYLEQRIKNPQIDCFYVYQCSFSTNKDSLCMWNYYTKSDSIKGFNLKFDKMEDYDLLKIKSKDGFGKLKVYSGKVIYDTDKQISTLKDVLNQFEKFTRRSGLSADMIAKYAVDKIAHIGEFFKKSCFRVEEEYRVSISPVLNDDGTFMTIDYERKFREKNGLFIPYIDIEFNSELLVGITMSPTLNPDDTIQGILSLTKNKDHNITKDSIVPSEIPIRY